LASGLIESDIGGWSTHPLIPRQQQKGKWAGLDGLGRPRLTAMNANWSGVTFDATG